MKLKLWLWDMVLQGRDFRNKTNDNWNAIMKYVDETEEQNRQLNERMDMAVNGVTIDSEVILARTDSRQVNQTTLAKRLQAEINYLTPTENIVTIVHEPNLYPVIQCFSYDYTFGTVDYANERYNATSVPIKIEHLDNRRFRLYVPKIFVYKAAKIIALATGETVYTDGVKTLLIQTKKVG
ncbi:hypothetical protein ACTRF2_001108 [Listeria monocytogenes]